MCFTPPILAINEGLTLKIHEPGNESENCPLNEVCPWMKIQASHSEHILEKSFPKILKHKLPYWCGLT